MKWIQKLLVVLFVVLASTTVMAYDFADAVDSNKDGVGIAPYPVNGNEDINAILDFEVEDPIYVWEKNGKEQDEYVGSVIPALELVEGDEWEVTVSYMVYVGGRVGYIEIELGSEAVEVEESEEIDGNNHAPKATDISFTVTEGDLVNINLVQDNLYLFYKTHSLLATFGDAETVYAYDMDGDHLSIYFTEPFNDKGDWQTNVGDVGVYLFNAYVSDGVENTLVIIVVNVQAVEEENENTCPVVTANDIVVNEGDLAVADYTATDADGDALSVSFTSPYDSNGEWQTYSGYAGVYYTTISVSDGECVVEEQFMTTVNEVVVEENTCPVVTANDIVVNEGDLAVADYTATDADGDALSVSFTSPYDSNGEWQTYSGYAGVYYTTISVSDGECVVEEQFMTTVNEVVVEENTCPVVTANDIVVNEGDLAVADYIATDADGDALSVSFTSPYDSNGEWQTYSGYGGVYYTTISVSDGECVVEEQFMTTVNEVVVEENTCPVVTANDIVVNEGDLAVADYIATDADGDALSVSFTSPYDSNGEWQTYSGYGGVYYTTISVSDGECVVEEQFMTTVNEVVVEEENTAPVIEDVIDVEVDEGETVNICPIATDAEGDVLVYTYEGLPGGSVDENGCWTWDTTYNDAGKYEDVEVCVSDGELSDCTSFDVKVNDVCDDFNENDICDEDEYVESNFEGGLLKIQYVTVLNAEDLRIGNDDEIKVYVEMQNDNSYDAENIQVTLIFNGEDYTYSFQSLDRSEVGSAVYTVEVPEGLENGRYPLIVKINNEDINYETAFNLNIEWVVLEESTIESELTLWEEVIAFFRNLF